MKGRTTCPECKKEFILDLPKDDKRYAEINEIRKSFLEKPKEMKAEKGLEAK